MASQTYMPSARHGTHRLVWGADGQSCSRCGYTREAIEDNLISKECPLGAPMGKTVVVDLQTPRGKTVVEVCTELLDRARKGEIQDIAAALLFTDGESGLLVAESEHFGELIGAVAQMQFDMMLQRHQH